MEYTKYPQKKRGKTRKPTLSPLKQAPKTDNVILNNSADLVELNGVTDLFRLLDLEMDNQIDCFFYKGQKYKLNVGENRISKSLFKFLSSSIPKNVAKRISMEEEETDLRRNYGQTRDNDNETSPYPKERPSTTGGRIFGAVSKDLHSQYKPVGRKIDLPSG